MFTEFTSTLGITQFTSYAAELCDDQKIKHNNDILLSWQTLNETNADHGLGLTYSILFDEGFGRLGFRSLCALRSEVASELRKGGQEWFESTCAKLKKDSDDPDGDRVFITAVWADLFADKFGELWLAAMAQHAYYVSEDDFAFGYLACELQHRVRSNENFLRGHDQLVSAKAGGQARASALRARRTDILKEVDRLVSKGHSVVRAATLAKTNGFGKSGEANRKLWFRHRK